MRRNSLNRGRFQAQGNRLEESRSWDMEIVPTKTDGTSYLNELKNKLSSTEYRLRKTCFEKARNWVEGAPSNGYVVVTTVKTSFKPSPPIKDIRVDGELFSGTAFKDNDV